MRKLAIFVEGLTELNFVEKLLEEIAGTRSIVFEKRQIVGGSNVPRRVISISAAKAVSDEKYYVLIFDCGGDHQVKPRIVEEHATLHKAGYFKIIGLRDVRPNTSRDDIPVLMRNLKYGIKTALVPVEILLATMEIEAWFLAEAGHFQKIDESITPNRIEEVLGFRPDEDDVSLRDHPADDLSKIYQIGGKDYVKPANETINALDYSRLYIELPEKIDALKSLVDNIDAFLDANEPA